MIRHICDNQNYVLSNYKEFCETISTLFKYMNHIRKIEFDEDLILVMTSLITLGKKVPQEAINFFQYTPKYFKKNKGLMLDLFELLNAYIIYGSEMFDSDFEYIKILCDIIKKSITEYSDYDKSSYLGYNLLSILLQVKSFFSFFEKFFEFSYFFFILDIHKTGS